MSEKMDTPFEADAGVEFSLGRAIDRSRDGKDGCHYKVLFNSVCSLDKDETGKPMQICERTERLLRRCPGRPEEIVESTTEKTVEEASSCYSGYLLDKEVRGNRGFLQPQWQDRFGIERGRESEHSLSRDFFGRNAELYAGPFEELVQAAEDIVRDVFGPFDMSKEAPARQPAVSKVERPSGWFWGALLGRDQNESSDRDETKSQQPQPQKQADYSGLTRKIQEI